MPPGGGTVAPCSIQDKPIEEKPTGSFDLLDIEDVEQYPSICEHGVNIDEGRCPRCDYWHKGDMLRDQERGT